MTLLPMIGHDALRERFSAALVRQTLPSSLLLHGRRGVGKQRLALWLAQAQLCASSTPPCGTCQHCRFALDLTHPDLYWFFPVARAELSDASPDEALATMRTAMRERAAAHGLWGMSSGSDGLFIEAIRALHLAASKAPALAGHKVMIIGDAERMIAQAGSDQAANALLKLLEEPPANTRVILTCSEPGSLLPTTRSRVVSVFVTPLTPRQVREWMSQDAVTAKIGWLHDGAELRAHGAPGSLLEGGKAESAETHAKSWVKALGSDASGRFMAILSEKPAGARGTFADALDALGEQLHSRLQTAVATENVDAIALAKAQDAIHAARERTEHNVNPTLITAELLRELRSIGVNA